jgi:hypothetical protein
VTRQSFGRMYRADSANPTSTKCVAWIIKLSSTIIRILACGQSWRAKQKPPPRLALDGGLINSGDDLLSRCSHYHRPQVLNGRVRNGNGCGHLGKVTGSFIGIFDLGFSIFDCEAIIDRNPASKMRGYQMVAGEFLKMSLIDDGTVRAHSRKLSG